MSQTIVCLLCPDGAEFVCELGTQLRAHALETHGIAEEDFAKAKGQFVMHACGGRNGSMHVAKFQLEDGRDLCSRSNGNLGEGKARKRAKGDKPVTREHQPCTVPRSCRSCGASIFWTETTNGKKMPVDCSPVTDGQYVLRHRKSEDKLFADKYQGEEVHHGRLRYRCHWATCPNADQHRKSR